MSTTHRTIGLVLVVGILGLTAASGSVASQSDIQIVDVSNGTDTTADVSLPVDERPMITVANVSGGNIADNAISVEGPGQPAKSSIPSQVDIEVDQAGTYDIIYNGQLIGSRSVEMKTVEVESITLNNSALSTANSVNITYSPEEYDKFAEKTPTGLKYTVSTQYNVIFGDAVDNKTDLTDNQNWGIITSSISGNTTTIYTSDSVETVEIDGETVYSESVLGGGGDGESILSGIDDQTLLGAGAVLVVVLILSRD